jgi:hypothetical protein
MNDQNSNSDSIIYEYESYELRYRIELYEFELQKLLN